MAPPPAPAPGQTAVWVVPALNLERTTQADREQVAKVLRQRLAAGDGVMLTLDYDPEAEFRPSDPLIELSRSWGITPRNHQLVLREDLGSDGRPRGAAGWVMRRWPEGSPLSNALAGREVQWVAPTPLVFEDRPRVETFAVARLTDDRAWIADALTTPAQIAADRYTAAKAVGDDGVVIAAGAMGQRPTGQALPENPGRLLVFSERHWFTDTQAGRRLGNSELFVNAAYWLAGLDEAIAATPRTQDLRRIADLSDTASLAYRWILLAGLPALSLLLGIGVWAWRRRG